VFLVLEALRFHGIQAHVQRCRDGEEAIRAISEIEEKRLPDVIIIDLNLPKIAGHEILKHLRGLRKFDDVPVVILTSSQSTVDRELARQYGADAYISKPPTLSDFLSTVGSGIRAVLDRSHSEARARLRTSFCGGAKIPRRPLLVRPLHVRARVRGKRLL
jgi:DNA-binding response OmpR family regulator